MEILMKLKCSPTPARSPHVHKMIDHQQQQQATPPPPQPQQQRNLIGMSNTNNCVDFGRHSLTSSSTLDCCSPHSSNVGNFMNLQTHCYNGSSCCSASSYPMCCNGNGGCPSTLSAQMPLPYASVEGSAEGGAEVRYEYQEPEENFVSIDDAKIKSFLTQIGQQQQQKSKEEKLKQQQQEKVDENVAKEKERSVLYEIIDLDDEEEREKLKRLKNQAEYDAKHKKKPTTKNHNNNNNNNEVQHENNDNKVDEQKKNADFTRCSPNISLVPAATKTTKTQGKTKQSTTGPLRIIASIDLLDSSEEEGEEEEEATEEEQKFEDELDDDEPFRDEAGNILRVMSDDEGNDALVPATDDFDDDYDDDNYDDDLPLAAANSVSCELQYDDNDDDEEFIKITRKEEEQPTNEEIVVLASDEENEEFIEREKGREVRWTELQMNQQQQQRTSRSSNFECYVCGKKVQSNYNLRRHMMIHTGERPFGCDLCERRFREFSDLKKHRRRHANEVNFKCMVCRVNPPSDCDPTRCNNCDSKMGALVALRTKHGSATEEIPAHLARKPPAPTIPPKKSPPPLIKPTATTTTTTTTSNRTSKQKSPPIEMSTSTTTTVTKTVSNAKSEIKQKPQKQLPPLTPILSTQSFETQLHMLDSIAPVHSSFYTKGIGVVTRKVYPCPLCQRPFGTRHNLKRHFMIHTGEKPFSCVRCRKPFREYSTLKKHMVTHVRERWYKCIRCPEKFLDYLEYGKHKRVHMEDPNTLDDASASSNTSTQSSGAKKPKLLEDSYGSLDEDSSNTDDWLECCECGQRFTELELYTEHLRLHDNEPDLCYECYICKKSLLSFSEFEQHMKIEHSTLMENSDDECEDIGDGSFLLSDEQADPELLMIPIGTKRESHFSSR